VLAVAVLGPVEVRRDGAPRPVPGGRTTELLVRLALDAGTRVTTERLIEDLWAGDAVATARNTLQSKVSQLRRALGGPDAVVAEHGGYRLGIDPDDVDVARATRLAGAVADARRRGDVAGVLAAATEGLSLFRGELLTGAGDGEWVAAHRSRLDELRRGLLEAQLAARADLDPSDGVVGELESLVAEMPHREGLWIALITALWRAGRQGEALAAGRRVRRLLADDLGLVPGPELQALERAILDQRPVTAAPAPAPPSTPRGNVPTFGTATVGRADAVAAVLDLLRRERLVTIVGPAGVGKTRLAVEVARALPVADGPWLVRLEHVPADDTVAPVVAETIGASVGPASLLERLAGTDAVIVMDNCEHVVEAAAAVVVDVLEAAPGTRVVATSQRPLGLDGEVVFELAPLGLGDAVELFVARGRRDRVADHDLVLDVCRALDGLPLAIELAAARTRSLTLADIARRLDQRFAILSDPTGPRPGRRTALAAAIAWSYDLLFPDDQRCLWALACFGDGAPLDAAQAVASAIGVPHGASLDSFDRLVDRSLAHADPGADGGVRYRLLDSIRSFAGDRLDEAGGSDAARLAHARWIAEVADRVGRQIGGPDQRSGALAARAERANVDLALAWSAAHEPALGVAIVNGFGPAWTVLGDGAAGAARIRAAIVAAPGTSAAAAVSSWLLASWLEASAGDVELAASDVRHADALAAPLDAPAIRADVLRHHAFLAIQQGRPDDALDHALASLEIAARTGNERQVAAASNLVAYGRMARGELDAAQEAATVALDLRTALGDTWGQMHAEAMLGRIAGAAGDLAEAQNRLRRAASRSLELGFAGQTALHLTSLGALQQQHGSNTEAIATLQDALAAAAAAGDRRIAATARLHLAHSLHALDRPDEAASNLRQNMEWYAAAGGGDGQQASIELLARIDAAR
jgi:predicted ATPase/DNA-binding SARP family transcriptional activator